MAPVYGGERCELRGRRSARRPGAGHKNTRIRSEHDAAATELGVDGQAFWRRLEAYTHLTYAKVRNTVGLSVMALNGIADHEIGVTD